MMIPSTPTVDASYRRYVELLLRHHRLLSGGKEADAETEDVETQMSDLWEGLDEAQRQSLSGLGSDLNWARRGCQPPPRVRKAEDVTTEDLQTLGKARDRSDWHGLLHSLRVCAPKLPVKQLAEWRATAWNALRFPEVGSVFSELVVQEPHGDLSSAAGR